MLSHEMTPVEEMDSYLAEKNVARASIGLLWPRGEGLTTMPYGPSRVLVVEGPHNHLVSNFVSMIF